MNQPVIALCYGTRPQVIKASVLRRALERNTQVMAVDTGQHYDYELNQLLYEQLGVAPPDRFLETGSGSHAEQTASILTRTDALLRTERPRMVVVIGDTNSTLGCALAAVKARIPVVHVEAGLRAADGLMAEEINRRMVDAVSDVLCAPSAAAAELLRRERPGASIHQTGDVACDVLRRLEDTLPSPTDLLPEGVQPPFYYATLHRAELTDDAVRLRGVIETLAALDRPVVLPLHPRTRAALGVNGSLPQRRDNLFLIPATGYVESAGFARSATAVITDSGGVQREAYWLGTPCVTLRGETEWHETVAAGANLLVNPDDAPETLAGAIGRQCARWKGREWDCGAYGDGNAAGRVADAVNRWLEQHA